MKNITQIFILLLYFSPIVSFASQESDRDLELFVHSERKSSSITKDWFQQRKENISQFVKIPLKAIYTTLTGASILQMIQSLGVLAETPSPTVTLGSSREVSQELARTLMFCGWGIVIMVIVICYCCRDKIGGCISKCTKKLFPCAREYSSDVKNSLVLLE